MPEPPDEQLFDGDELDDAGDSVIEGLRASPVGTNDPNIVGDAGPLDIPPGSDGPLPTPEPSEDAIGDGTSA